MFFLLNNNLILQGNIKEQHEDNIVLESGSITYQAQGNSDLAKLLQGKQDHRYFSYTDDQEISIPLGIIIFRHEIKGQKIIEGYRKIV